MTLVEMLARAAQLRLNEDFAAAQSLCMDVLGQDSANAEAMSLLGVCALETGDVSGGRQWLDKAEAAQPDLAVLHLYRSMQHEISGDADQALASAKRAAELAPERFDVWGRYGDLAGRVGDLTTAAMALGRALDSDPQHPARGGVALRLAGALVETGNIAETEAALATAEAAGLTGHPEVHRLRAAIARQIGAWDDMARHAKIWFEADESDEEARGAYALALGQQGYYNRASDIFRPVAEATPPSAEHWAALGRFRLGARDTEDARVCLKCALSIDPRSAEANFGMARVMTVLGSLETAEMMCRRTLQIDASNLEAYGQLCEVSGGRISDEELARLTEETEKDGVPADQLSIGLFALGDALHRQKSSDRAFEAWTRGNATKKVQHGHAQSGGYDRGAQEAKIDRLIELFATDLETPGGATPDRPVPLFIVGMPRSGTTLIETAIAAHDDVKGGGELPALPFILDEFLAWTKSSGWSGGVIPEEVLARWRSRYFSQYDEFKLGGAKFVTDKQPSNFMSVGLIRQLFPTARIIHIRRRPLETAFSIYRRNFSRMWPFAHDMSDIAHYYSEQARLCAHWDSRIETKFTSVQYEEFVADFENQLRVVLARSGLNWNRKCLEYYKQDRAQMTFSAVQVRKPPSVEHLNSTDAYASHLSGFDEDIRALGVDPVTGKMLSELSDADPSSGRGKSASDADKSGGLLSSFGSMFGSKKT
jgi:tetratricopeptide (TPR) repeat protein